MIIIAGNTHDDILYFESIMTNKKNEIVFNRYNTIVGNIFNQDVLLVYGIYTNYVSSAVISHLIDKYFVVLVFNVGKCTSFSNTLNNGDIVISDRIYLADVDQMEEANTRLGQIPGYGCYYEVQHDIIESLNKSMEMRTYAPNKVGNFISSNTYYTSIDQLDHIRIDDSIYGVRDNIVLDCNSGGCALACAMHSIPFVAAKVVYKRLGEKNSAKLYATVLKNYTGVGKAVVTCIGDISRNDIIREGE